MNKVKREGKTKTYNKRKTNLKTKTKKNTAKYCNHLFAKQIVQAKPVIIVSYKRVYVCVSGYMDAYTWVNPVWLSCGNFTRLDQVFQRTVIWPISTFKPGDMHSSFIRTKWVVFKHYTRFQLRHTFFFLSFIYFYIFSHPYAVKMTCTFFCG